MLKDLGFVTDGLSFASATSAVLFIVLISYTFNRWITGKGSSELLLVSIDIHTEQKEKRSSLEIVEESREINSIITL